MAAPIFWLAASIFSFAAVRPASSAPQTSDSVQRLTSECEQGKFASCGVLGFIYVSGSGVAKDEARGAALFQRGCDGGDAMGCVGLGHVYWNAHGVAKDEARAAALYQRGCDGGAAMGCSSLARLLLLSTTEQPDPKAALVLARKAVQITNSKDAYYLDTLAWVLYANGLRAEALETERKALKLEPDNQKWKERVAFFSKAVK